MYDPVYMKSGDSPIFRKYVVGWCSGAFSPLLSFPAASREQYLHIFDLIICSRRRGHFRPSFFFLPCPKVSGHKSEDLAVFAAAAAAAIPYRPSLPLFPKTMRSHSHELLDQQWRSVEKHPLPLPLFLLRVFHYVGDITCRRGGSPRHCLTGWRWCTVIFGKIWYFNTIPLSEYCSKTVREESTSKQLHSG